MDTPHMFPEKQIGLPTLNAVDHLDPVAYLHRENCAMHHSRLLLVRSGHFTMNMANAQYELSGGDLMFTPAELPYAYTTGKDARLSNLYFYLPETFAPDEFSMPFALSGDTESESLFFRIGQAHLEQRVGYVFEEQLLLSELLLRLLRRRRAVSTESIGATDRILGYITAHCEEHLDTAALCRTLHYSESHLNRLVMRATGMALHTYILNTKVCRATELLVSTDKSIAEIAQQLAFYDSSHFASVFRRYIGLPPTAYRKKHGTLS